MSKNQEKDIQHIKSKNLLFTIIGFATLIALFVGATYSFFSASKESTGNIVGSAAKPGVSLVITKESNEPTTGLIPMSDADISKGLAGKSGQKCVDQDGHAVCQLYKVAISNTGTTNLTLDGTLTLTPTNTDNDSFSNLKWAEITSGTDATVIGNKNAYTVTNWKDNETLTTGQTKNLYLLIWISEAGRDQGPNDNGNFNGTVTFTAVSGAQTGVTATFSS